MSTFEMAGRTYRIGPMNAMTQFHVTRRLGPALVVCGITVKMAMEGAAVSLDDWAAVAGPVMHIVSKMSDEDSEYVINACLRCVDAQQQDKWAPILTPDGQLMFGDIDMAGMLRLTVEVLRDKLSNFAKGLTAGGNSGESSGAARPSTSTP